MWKPNQSSSPTPIPEPVRPATPVPSFEPSRSSTTTTTPVGEQAILGKAIVFKGEITGGESLLVEGKIEGTINLPGNRVTVGRNGQVAANITAREIIVLGKIRGNVVASDRVDIRAEGSLSGDVTAARISIEDGAFFKGGIDIRKPGSEKPTAPELFEDKTEGTYTSLK
jgi:cytoskeletal protein CcmA (bactofilin family)